MTYKEREARLISEMENRTAYNDGLTIPELLKRVLGYELQMSYGKSIQSTRQKWKCGTDGKYYVGDDMCAVEAGHFDKLEEDWRRIQQLKQMIKRTRKKYRSGSRINDTPIDRHQYYLIPPKLQEENRLWRCVHFVPGINQYLFEPLIMRSYQQEAGLVKKQKRLKELEKLSEEDFVRPYEKILEHVKTREQVKQLEKEEEERRKKEAVKEQKKMNEFTD